MIAYLFTGLLTCIGLANIFASSLDQVHQRNREFARYFAVSLTPKGSAKILAWEAVVSKIIIYNKIELNEKYKFPCFTDTSNTNL